jgi:hypothetical protein
MWSRIHLIPLLTAEEDRDLVRRHVADQAREKKLMGSETSPYNSDRYVSSHVILLHIWDTFSRIAWIAWATRRDEEGIGTFVVDRGAGGSKIHANKQTDMSGRPLQSHRARRLYERADLGLLLGHWQGNG